MGKVTIGHSTSPLPIPIYIVNPLGLERGAAPDRPQSVPKKAGFLRLLLFHFYYFISIPDSASDYHSLPVSFQGWGIQ